MPDVPAAVAAPVTPSPTPLPAPTPDVMGQLKPDDPILVRDKTGNVVNTKLGDLAEAWRNRPEAADMEDLGLLRQAIKENNVEAAQKLVNKYTPAAAAPTLTPPATPANAELVALRAEMKTMQESMARMSPTTASVQEAMETFQLTQVIDASKNKVPLLAKHPDRAVLVRNRLGYYAEQARVHNLSLDALPLEVRRQVHEKALADVESSLRTTLEIYGFKPGQAPARNPVSVNDQEQPDQRQVREPRYKVVDGKLVDTTMPTAAPAASAALPTAPVSPLPSGGMVGVEDASRDGGRVTPAQLMDRMRQRSQVLSQTV